MTTTTTTETITTEALVPQQQFAIDSIDRLAWYGRKRGAIQAEIARVEANAKAITDDLRKELQDFDARFQVQAEDFARRTLEATGWKSKTLKTLGGAFSFRTVPGGIRKAEPATLLAWAKEHAPALVKREEIVKEDVPAEALKAYVAEMTAANGGEFVIPPGAELVPDRESFSIKSEA